MPASGAPPPARLLDAEVGEEEMVVDDDDVALERLAPHLGDGKPLRLKVRAWIARGRPRCARPSFAQSWLFSGSVFNSARSPVVVVFSHWTIWWN